MRCIAAQSDALDEIAYVYQSFMGFSFEDSGKAFQVLFVIFPHPVLHLSSLEP